MCVNVKVVIRTYCNRFSWLVFLCTGDCLEGYFMYSRPAFIPTEAYPQRSGMLSRLVFLPTGACLLGLGLLS